MNTRILELISNPQDIELQDLSTISEVLKKYPYAQSFRALHLLATARFSPENYSNTLATAAAFTTDKKILYHLINGRNTVSIDSEKDAKRSTLSDDKVKNEEQETTLQLTQNFQESISNIEEIKKNTATDNPDEDDFPKEKQDFSVVEESNDKSFIESEELSLEITENKESLSSFLSDFTDTSIPSGEENEHEDYFQEDKETDYSINYHENIESEYTHPAPKHRETFTPVSSVNAMDKFEIERQNLIAEVERKLKEKKKSEARKVSATDDFLEKNNQIDFYESDIVEEETTNQWTPMNPTAVESSFRKKSVISAEKEESSESEEKKFTEEAKRESVHTDETRNRDNSRNEEEMPVISASFFSPTITQIDTESSIEQKEENTNTKKNSNIPSFLSTWQNWLKIDKKDSIKSFSPKPKIEEIKARKIDEFIETKPETSFQKETFTIEEIKERAIDSFIENEPKISKRKEESNFVVKEKTDDISHLMTETLANLYVEQRLYTKAQHAFEILIEKHPSKKKYFQDRIEEVKELRTKGLL